MFCIMKNLKHSANMHKYNAELKNSIDHIAKLNVMIGADGATRYCVFVKPDADIYSVQEIFAKCGIDLKKHFIKENKVQKDMLYINVVDFAKLNTKAQKFFEELAKNE